MVQCPIRQAEEPPIVSTQAELDAAYREGKAAFFFSVGTHGPTLKKIIVNRMRNPYPRDSKLALAWERGYNQDVRRVIGDR